jgi:hypothetical protein
MSLEESCELAQRVLRCPALGPWSVVLAGRNSPWNLEKSFKSTAAFKKSLLKHLSKQDKEKSKAQRDRTKRS